MNTYADMYTHTDTLILKSAHMHLHTPAILTYYEILIYA